MELTKTKLNNILKKYSIKLDQYNKEWDDLCRQKSKTTTRGIKVIVATPTIFDHEQHASKGAQLFKDLMSELGQYHVFPEKNGK